MTATSEAVAPVTLLIEPAGIELSVAPGETVLAAARRAGLVWRSVCGGHAQCRTCYFTTPAPDAFASPLPIEASALRLIGPAVTGAPAGQAGEGGVVRLACQARPRAAASVRKMGVREA